MMAESVSAVASIVPGQHGAMMTTRRRKINVHQRPSRIQAQLLRSVKFCTPWPVRTLRRWRSEGLIFSVRWRGRDLYPAFQFGPCDFPWYGMKRMLWHVPKSARGWPLLSWFEARNVILKGRKPSRALKTESTELLIRSIQLFYNVEE